MKTPQELYNWIIVEMHRFQALKQIAEAEKAEGTVKCYTGQIEALGTVATNLVIYFGCQSSVN
ncbi:MAG: hypothetical protein ABSG22_10760 [Sedimentisphaerales bacterium]